ncbi:hypothetical protein CWC05_12280 [Pseudoalteromonas ruthenica]|uniref:Solute-binding protein family 3/N-terminal domain-containing protein n=1 Tax=Pseudoalteromonas ruthenica TaxID=151081 RepID=A0A5S3Z2R7_9GAMM|nr:hypothetical protein CWC31_12145 [Pseudoalteromonas ruthenica]TMP86574.1 hypothetical protein CWC05_12280 [Pseudoalteromonas ruthenica]
MCVGKFLLIILLFSSTAFGQCTNPIRVGVNSEWPPYISIENDHISGLDMAIITLLLESMGRCFDYVRLPSAGRSMNELRAGRIDLLSGVSFAAYRQDIGQFSAPYRQEIVRLVVSERVQASALADLQAMLQSGLTLVYTPGAYYGEEVETLVQQSRYQQQIQTVSEPVKRYLMLKAGRADVTIEDEQVAKHLLSEYGGAQLMLHPKVVSAQPIHFLISHQLSNTGFMRELNQAIEAQQQAITALLQNQLGAAHP